MGQELGITGHGTSGNIASSGTAPQTNTGAVSSSGGTMLGAIAGGLIGMGQGAINNNQNKKAQERAYNMQRELNKQAKELALQQWKDTNYGAQRKELEKAGLSTGLMYGQSGGGGVTAQTGSGGSAPSQAPAQYNIGMGIEGMQTMMQMKMMEAQIDKTKAETENLRGADRENTVADTGVKTQQAKNQEILNNINNRTLDEQVQEIIANANTAQSEARSALVGANVDETTQKSREAKIVQDAVNTGLQAGAIKAGIKLTEEQTRKIGEELAQGWEELYQKARGNDNQAGMVNIAGFNAKLNEILGKANIDLRSKELMLRAGEAVLNGMKSRPKGSTTETYDDGAGGKTSNTTYH